VGRYPGTAAAAPRLERGNRDSPQDRAAKASHSTIAFKAAIRRTCVRHGRCDLEAAGWVLRLPAGVVVDDAAQGVTHVVRGADLLADTPRQIYLQRTLALQPPDMHFPVLVESDGSKLAKSARSTPRVSQDSNQLLSPTIAGNAAPITLQERP